MVEETPERNKMGSKSPLQARIKGSTAAASPTGADNGAILRQNSSSTARSASSQGVPLLPLDKIHGKHQGSNTHRSISSSPGKKVSFDAQHPNSLDNSRQRTDRRRTTSSRSLFASSNESESGTWNQPHASTKKFINEEYGASNELPVILTEAKIHEEEQIKDSDPLFDHCVELRPLRVNSFSMTKGVRNHDNYFLRAFHARSQGKIHRAIYLYTEALHLKPDDFKSAFNRGYAYDRLGLLEEAVADYSHALTIEPKSALALFNRGLVEARLGNLKQSIATLTNAIEIQFKSVSSLRDSLAVADSLQPDDCTEFEFKERTAAAALVLLLRMRGLVYRRDGQFSEASRDYFEANRTIRPSFEDDEAERRFKQQLERNKDKIDLIDTARSRMYARSMLTDRLGEFSTSASGHVSVDQNSQDSRETHINNEEYVHVWGERQLGALLRDCMLKDAYDKFEEELRSYESQMVRLEEGEVRPKKPNLVDFLESHGCASHAEDVSATAHTIWRSCLQQELATSSFKTVVVGAPIGHGATKVGRQGQVTKEYRRGLEPSVVEDSLETGDAETQELDKDLRNQGKRSGIKGSTMMQPFCFSDGPIYSPGNIIPTKNAAYACSPRDQLSHLLPQLHVRTDGSSVRANRKTREQLKPITIQDIDFLGNLTLHVKLFANQPQRVKEALLSRLYWRELKKGEKICNEGEFADCLYVIVEGSADLFVRKNKTSGRRIIQVMGALKMGKFLVNWLHRFRTRKRELKGQAAPPAPTFKVSQLRKLMEGYANPFEHSEPIKPFQTSSPTEVDYGIRIGSIYTGEGLGEDSITKSLRRIWWHDANQGEGDYLNVQFRPMTAVCREPCLLLALRRDDYDYVMECHSQVVVADKAAWLSKLPLMQSASQEEISRMAQHIEHRRFRCGDVVLSQDMPLDGLYIVRSGKCVVSRVETTGKDVRGPKQRTGTENMAAQIFRRASMSQWITINEKGPRADNLSKVNAAAASAAKARSGYKDDLSLEQVNKTKLQSRRSSAEQIGSERALQRRLSVTSQDETLKEYKKPKPPSSSRRNVTETKFNRKAKTAQSSALNPSSSIQGGVQYLGELFPRDWFGEAYALSARKEISHASGGAVASPYHQCIESVRMDKLGISKANIIAETDVEVWVLRRHDMYDICSFSTRQKMREYLGRMAHATKIFSPSQQKAWTEYKKIILDQEVPKKKSRTARF